MTSFVNFGLTEYTDFRNLQFEYTKLKDENNQLKIKIAKGQKLYEQISLEYYQQRNQFLQQQTELKNQLAQTHQQVDESKQTAKEIWLNLGAFLQNQMQYPQHMNLNEIIKQIEKILQSIIENDVQTKQTIKQINDQNKKKQKEWTFREQNLAQKISQLQEDLTNLENMRLQLHAQNNMLLKQNEELAMQVASYKLLAEQARLKTPSKQPKYEGQQIKDDAFAVDLLTYEKQYLTRVFTSMIDAFKNEQFRISMEKIYENYEEIVLCFKQKLQLQYDLEDLQYQYKKQRKNQDDTVMIELRKQIQNLRKQLQDQKQQLSELEESIQGKMKDFQSLELQEERLRNMTYEMQTKLRKKNQMDYDDSRRITCLKTTNTDNFMKEMIEKDRENLQRILKETRSYYKK